MKYCIWSNEHNSWWRADSMGYTMNVDRAGRYDFIEALSICNGANYSWNLDSLKKLPNELPISEEIAVMLSNKQWLSTKEAATGKGE